MKDKIISITFVSILLIFSCLSLILKDRDISSYERRKLTNSTSLKEDFITNLDDYLTDQFPLRDLLISTNSTFDRYILGNSDDNNVYIKEGYLIDKNYPLNQKNKQGFINKINYINNKYLQESNVYYTIIPDKAYFLNEANSLKLNYQELFEDLENNINISYIDITSLLRLEDYYKTDIHIKQDSYFKIIKEFSNHLNFNYENIEYQEYTYENFYGASYSKVPSFIKPDTIKYLTNSTTENAIVKHLEYGQKDVYEEEKLESVDAYNIFLGGPSSLIEIENNESGNDKELIIFRDSFASSFTPLLIPYYKKITLIDLRYIKEDIASNYVDFKNKDVLFAYSTLIVNDSHLLKVSMK